MDSNFSTEDETSDNDVSNILHNISREIFNTEASQENVGKII